MSEDFEAIAKKYLEEFMRVLIDENHYRWLRDEDVKVAFTKALQESYSRGVEARLPSEDECYRYGEKELCDETGAISGCEIDIWMKCYHFLKSNLKPAPTIIGSSTNGHGLWNHDCPKTAGAFPGLVKEGEVCFLCGKRPQHKWSL